MNDKFNKPTDITKSVINVESVDPNLLNEVKLELAIKKLN